MKNYNEPNVLPIVVLCLMFLTIAASAVVWTIGSALWQWLAN